MKSNPLFVLIISIIFGLIAFISLTEGKTVWIQNKLVRGTFAIVYAWTDYKCESRECYIADGRSHAHKGFSLTVPDDKSKFYLSLDVLDSLQQAKWRGPFDNTQDICWHYHGSLDDWTVYPCP